MTIIIACLNHFDVGLGDGGLLGELFLQEVGHEVEVAVEEPAHKTQGEHIAALQHSLVVHAGVFQCSLHHLCHGTGNDAISINVHLTEIVFCLKLCLLQILRAETVGIDNNGCPRLSIAILSLQGGSIHSYQYVAQVTRRVDLACADVHLKAADASQ